MSKEKALTIIGAFLFAVGIVPFFKFILVPIVEYLFELTFKFSGLISNNIWCCFLVPIGIILIAVYHKKDSSKPLVENWDELLEKVSPEELWKGEEIQEENLYPEKIIPIEFTQNYLPMAEEPQKQKVDR